MKHCVFCASVNHPKNQVAIFAAKAAMFRMDLEWMLEYDVCGAVHSAITESNDFSNYSIWLENENVQDLIKDCMYFAWLRCGYERDKERIS